MATAEVKEVKLTEAGKVWATVRVVLTEEETAQHVNLEVSSSRTAHRVRAAAGRALKEAGIALRKGRIYQCTGGAGSLLEYDYVVGTYQ